MFWNCVDSIHGGGGEALHLQSLVPLSPRCMEWFCMHTACMCTNCVCKTHTAQALYGWQSAFWRVPSIVWKLGQGQQRQPLPLSFTDMEILRVGREPRNPSCRFHHLCGLGFVVRSQGGKSRTPFTLLIVCLGILPWQMVIYPGSFWEWNLRQPSLFT